MTLLDKEYNPQLFEKRIYQAWEDHGCFTAPTDSTAKPYTIVIPPPNRTGVLHMGHALNNTLQDILIRWRRMQGYNACWVPGTDHAGIATQSVVERKLRREEGKTRHDYGREPFVELVRQFADEHGHIILNQLKMLGCSCDWSRTRYTFDEGLSGAVRSVFVHLYKKGLIYKGKAIVNMCPQHGSISDEEVEYKEVKGHLWHLRYPLTKPIPGGLSHIVVATTRPETMLGDVCVAVHPADPRYRDLIGSTVTLPLMNREIPIVADEFVDPEFGTGAVKVTPSHDPNDFECGRRVGIPGILIMQPNAVLNENTGAYVGLDRFEARKRVVADLDALGLLEKVEDHTNRVGFSQRSGLIIEPMESDQWFVAMKTLAEPALAAVREGRIRLHPERWNAVYYHWMENIRDWCISRQLWWGHRIPVWHCQDCKAVLCEEHDPSTCDKCGSTRLTQEEDTLDTWFSSWLWPFSVFDWPAQSADLKKFYPTDVLVTGPDILFFWVARMIMAGYEFMGDQPFADVVLTSIVRDENHQKMSKSLGNVIDPLLVIEGKFTSIFPKKKEAKDRPYGADALRLSLMLIGSIGSDNMALSYDKLEVGGSFINKLWNASRLLLNYLPDDLKCDFNAAHLGTCDRWVLDELRRLIARVTAHLDAFEFHEAATTLYDFTWYEFCDWYLEMIKPALQTENPSPAETATRAVARQVLATLLQLFHPIIPFVTEEIWSKLPGTKGFIMRSAWPAPDPSWDFPEEAAQVAMLKDVVRTARNLRAENDIKPSLKVPLLISCQETDSQSCLDQLGAVVERLANLSQVRFLGKSERPKFAATGILGKVELFIPLEGLVDVDAEKARLLGEMKKIEKEIEFFSRKLSDEKYIGGAPAHVVARDGEKLSEYKRTRDKFREALHRLERLNPEHDGQ